jgi:hypothetical protein
MQHIAKARKEPLLRYRFCSRFAEAREERDKQDKRPQYAEMQVRIVTGKKGWRSDLHGRSASEGERRKERSRKRRPVPQGEED